MSVAYVETSVLVAVAFGERGADLWHVAAALYVAPSAGDMTFVTRDRRQRDVAAAPGFQV